MKEKRDKCIEGAFSGKVKGKSPFPTLEDANREARQVPRIWEETR